MPISHRTNRLKLIGTPSVEQLQNGRYQLTVNCSTMNSREDWYSSNKARIFPDFGSLESAEMSIDGLAPRTGETYTDMRLVSVQSSTQEEKYIVTLVYQTLGDSFVQVKDDTVNYIENGLRRVTRQSIAKAGTDFQKTVGTTSIASQIDTETEVTCVLANYEVNDTDSYREVTEVYIQAGTLSETEDKVGSQLAIVKETFASTPSTPSGYSIASEQVSNFNGIPTKQFRFLKNDVTLLETEDKIGSQLAIVKEVFNGSPSTPSNYSLADSQISNVDGIPTKRFRFLKNDVVLSESEDKVGSQLAIVKEVFNGTPSTPSGYSIASEEKSNVDGIATNRFTFLKNGAVLSSTTEERQSGPNATGKVRIQTVEVFNGTPSSTIGGVQISEQQSNVGAIVTTRAVFATGSGEVSRTTETRNKGALIITTVESLGTAGTATGVEIEATSRQQDGYTLFRNVFASGAGEISRTTETRNKGALTITTIESLGSSITGSGLQIEATTREQDGFTLFRNVFASGTGEVSRTTETLKGGQLTITTIDSLNSAGSASGTKIQSTERQEDGYTLHRDVFALGDGADQVITSTKPGRIDGTTEVTFVSFDTNTVPTGVHIFESTTKEDGYTKFTNTSIQGTIEGVKQTYKDVVQVEVPGEVDCTTVDVSSGGVSGTIAVPFVTPRRKKSVVAQVTVEITSIPPDTASVAYDLGEISCSVTSTNVSLTRGAGNTVTVGTNAVISRTGFVQNFGASARIQTYPGCFLKNTSSSGTISYTASEQPRADGTNTIVVDTNDSSRDTTCQGTGSTEAEGYLTTGVLKRNSRPIITDLDGNTYYEVITWSV